MRLILFLIVGIVFVGCSEMDKKNIKHTNVIQSNTDSLQIQLEEEQFNSNIDTLYFVDSGKRDLNELNQSLYTFPDSLLFNWSEFQIVEGKSIDCDDKPFQFVFIMFKEDSIDENHFGFVLYRVDKNKKIIELYESAFTTETLDELIKGIDKTYYRDRWGCDI
jgi:hypothetical protein